MNKSKKQADWGVIFDLDGTMVDNSSYHRQAWFDVCRQYKIPMNMDLYHQKVHARSNDKIAVNLFGKDIDQAFIKRIEHEKESLYRQTYAPVMKAADGLIDLLKNLKAAQIPCGAASNSPKDNVDFILDGLNVRPYFSSVFYRDHVKVGKPNPEVLLKTADGLGLAAHRCILFEDSASARTAGIPYIAITAGADPNELKETYDAAAVLKDFTQVSVMDLALLLTPFQS